MKTAYDIILRPVITEKSMMDSADKKYVFEVAPSATKIEIKQAIAEIFGVKVKNVNTVNVKGKKKRTDNEEMRTRRFRSLLPSLNVIVIRLGFRALLNFGVPNALAKPPQRISERV